MPQFDFSNYTSQIFWFSLCFAALYSVLSLVILPRISDIIKLRKSVVDSDKSKTKKLETHIADLRNKAEKIKHEASDKYEEKLDEISRKAMKERDLVLTNLKQDLDDKVKNSRLEIRAFLNDSEIKAASTIQSLTKNIKTKILS